MRGTIAKKINKLCAKYHLKRKRIKAKWLAIPEPKEIWQFISRLEQIVLADGRKSKE